MQFFLAVSRVLKVPKYNKIPFKKPVRSLRYLFVYEFKNNLEMDYSHAIDIHAGENVVRVQGGPG